MGRIENDMPATAALRAPNPRLDPQYVGHWTNIRDLLDKGRQYQNEGLLDRTHLRFFTLDSIREMFDQARLQVHEIRGRDIYNEGFNDWIADTKITPRKEMRAYQYIVRAFKPGIETSSDSLLNGPAMPRYVEYPTLHIHAVTAEECCARPRIHEPFAATRTIPGVTCTTEIRDENASIFISSNAIATLLICRKNLIKIGLLLVSRDRRRAIGHWCLSPSPARRPRCPGQHGAAGRNRADTTQM